MKSLYSALAGYWNLQDASGNRLDLTGNGSTLTNTNTVTSVDGVVSKASNFVLASSQRLTCADNAAVRGGPKSFTLACWAQLATTPATDMELIAKWSVSANLPEYLLYWNAGSQRFQFGIYRAGDSLLSVQATTFGAPSTGIWYFIRAWYDHDALTVNIEVNMSGVDSAATVTPAQAASTAAFYIGSLTSTSYLNGKMCEVGKWDRVLTTQEALWLYNKGAGRTYPFDGRYSRDLTRHGRSRRLSGMAA